MVDDDANIMAGIVLFGGPQAGFNTNLEETEVKKPFMEIKGQKLVCVAQGESVDITTDIIVLEWGMQSRGELQL